MSYKPQDLSIEQLHFNLRNPRYLNVQNDNDAIVKILEDQGEKIIELGKHIIINGMNPNELAVAIKMTDEERHYYLEDGNRRLCVLKFFNDPYLIPKQFASVRKYFLGLTNVDKYKSFRCNVFDNVEDAHIWVKLKHTGENKGAGTVSWNSQQVDNYNTKISNKVSLPMQLLNYLKSIGFDEKHELDLSKITLTNLGRLLTDPDVREFLGMSVNHQCLESNIPWGELEKPILKIIKDLLTKQINVIDIYYKPDRASYIESFDVSEIPDKQKLVPIHRLHSNVTDDLKRNVQEDLFDTLEPGNRGHIKNHQLNINRNCLINYATKIKISNNKAQSIYNELKKLKIIDFPNACALLFRTFIEYSVTEFIIKYCNDSDNSKNLEDSKLNRKLELAKTYLVDNKHLTKDEVKPVNMAISSENSILSVNTMHAYVHNRNFQPLIQDLKQGWDNIEVFIKKLWELMGD